MSRIQLLQKIGLSKYQALIYECLLRKGPLDARTLSSESHVPMGKIYNSLSHLVESEIILEHSGRPKKFEAITPEIVFQRIYMRYYFEHEKQKEEFKGSITRLEQDLERKKPSFSNLPDFQIVYNNEDILNYLIRAHNEAKNEVIYVTHVRYGSFTSELDERTLYSLINSIGNLLKRGISVKVIFPDTPYVEFFSQITSHIQSGTSEHINPDLIEIRCRNTEHNFILIDDSVCIFELEDQRDLVRPYVMIRIRDPVLNVQLRAVFGKLWEDSNPVTDGSVHASVLDQCG